MKPKAKVTIEFIDFPEPDNAPIIRENLRQYIDRQDSIETLAALRIIRTEGRASIEDIMEATSMGKMAATTAVEKLLKQKRIRKGFLSERYSIA